MAHTVWAIFRENLTQFLKNLHGLNFTLINFSKGFEFTPNYFLSKFTNLSYTKSDQKTIF